MERQERRVASGPQMVNMNSPLGAMLKKIVFGGSVGIGATIAYVFLQAILKQPDLVKLLINVVGSWGPLMVVLLVGMYFANERMGEGLQVMRDNTSAQQDLANAVRSIAEKDDRTAEKQALLLGYVGQQLDKTLVQLTAISEKLNHLGPGKCGVQTAGDSGCGVEKK